MPFSPLPRTFLDDVAARGRGVVVDLGCGDGAMTRLLRERGANPVGIDRRPPWAGTAADLVADGRRLPLRAGSVDLLVAANLLRHLWPLPQGEPVPGDWLRVLAPGGRLYVLEDEPVARTPAERNYADLQDLLARIDPAGRRPLLARATFAARMATGAAWPGRWRLEEGENRLAADALAVARWLLGVGERATGEAAALSARVAAEGLSYGRYWCACFEPEEVA